ncbi:MAG TPA: DUF333 domain-containing protein [Arsenophonus sp.]
MKKILLLLTFIYLIGCSNTKESSIATKTIGMANPASVYCVQKIVTTATGEVGYCYLPSGVRIEEWTLYRQDHQ